MPEIATQTEERFIVEKSRAYLNLIIKFYSYKQDSVVCKTCGHKFKINHLDFHTKTCKRFNKTDYLNCC